jgi:hypothetical protein
MIDLLYILGALGFFALMLGYAAACEKLGRGEDDGDEQP